MQTPISLKNTYSKLETKFCIYLVQNILTRVKNSERERVCACVCGLQDWMAEWLRNACTGLVCACFQFEKM